MTFEMAISALRVANIFPGQRRLYVQSLKRRSFFFGCLQRETILRAPGSPRPAEAALRYDPFRLRGKNRSMNSFRPICLMLLLLGCARAAHSSSLASAAAGASPIPTPRCWIFDKTYPVTRAAYERQHATLTERAEIEKWTTPASPTQERLVRAQSPSTKPPSASEQHLVRWMRSPFESGEILVFVARPMEKTAHGYSPWVALNANVIIDTVEC
jgi:hypothetical protein